MAKTERYFEDFIKLPYITLKSMGYDFLDKPRSLLMKMLMNLYIFLTFICCLYCTYFVTDEIMNEIVAGVPNLPLLLRLINDLNYNAVGILKSLYFVRNLKGQKKMFQRFKEVFPKTIQARFAYQVNAKFWPRWITVLLYLYFVAVAFIIFSPLAASLVEYGVDLIRYGFAAANFTYHKMYEEQSYVLDHHSPLGYILIYSMETMNGHYAVIFNICPDIWLVAYAIQLCMHFDYISRSLESHEPTEGNCDKDFKFIASLVRKHQVLLELADDLKHNFSSLVFVMLFSTVGNLCCAGIYIISKGFTRDLLGYLGYFTTSMGQYYMVCYYGQEIINKFINNLSISTAMTKTERYFEDFTNLPYVTLKSLGYDFLDKPRSLLMKMLMNLYIFLTFICCLYCTYFVADEIMNEIVAGVHNLPLLLRLINDVYYNAIGILKSFCFVRNLKDHKKMFKRFREVFPKTIQDRFAYQVNAKFWPRWITVLLYLYFGAVACILFSPLAGSLVEYGVDLVRHGFAGANFTYHKLYDEQSYVLDHHSPLAYIIIYSMESMNSHYAIVFNICPDIWLVAYAIQLCMHFDYISRCLEDHEPTEGSSEKDFKFITSIVRKHQVLLELADDFKDNFSSLVFVMLFSTVGNLCCAGIYIISKGFTRDLLGYLAYFSTSIGQYYMVCYYGQEIINKSLEVGIAVYNHTWYNGCRSYKKSVLSILGRAQRQCEINAGGFQTTNLESFKKVMSMSFQLYTVSRTMMDPNQ